MHNLRSDIKALKPLNLIAKFLAILPNFDEDKLYQYRHGYIYTFIIGTLFITISSITMYGKLVHLIDYMETTVHFISVASEGAIMLTLFMSICGINLCNGRSVCKLLKLLQRIDKDFQYEARECKHWFGFRMELVAGQILFILYYMYSLFIWLTTLEFTVSKFFILRDLQVYHVITLALVLRNYALVIKYRFETLNKVLSKVVDQKDTVAVVKTPSSASNSDWTIKKLQKIYTDLSHTVMYYNKIFGWQFITLYSWVVTGVLMSIDMILVYGNGKNRLLGKIFSFDLMVLCGLWTFVPMIVMTGVIYACNAGSTEASSTADVCYKLINNLNNNENNVALKDDLLEFAHQVTSRCPQFTSAGVYSLNYSVLFTILGSVTTYLIVFIQFHN